MNKIISHEISKLGKIDIALHNKSAEFYNILETKGIIEHLKKLDHLGFISKSHPGNNHKRWDYVMLQLYFLHKLKDKIFKNGLGSDHKIVANQELSGIVILQIAVLFSNIGHLHGTLASEIALFNYLEREPERKKEFLQNISNVDILKKYAEKVFSEHDYYKIKYLIALNFLKKNVNDVQINSVIEKFFLNSIEEDEPSFRKLKWIFFKVRQISFIYLDSFNSDFPFNIEITKLLLNTINYPHLFNPNSSDYDTFFDSCETTLTKKIYISEKSCAELFHNDNLFTDYLIEHHNKANANKLIFENFTCSLISRAVKPFEVKPSEYSACLQFYLSKADFEIFGNKLELFNYSEANKINIKKTSEFNTIINKGLTNKTNKVYIINDQRKTLFYNNLLMDYSKLLEIEQNQFLLNYFNYHSEYLNSFIFNAQFEGLRNRAVGTFQKSYSRKVFLQLFKILFDFDYKLSAYIKFENQPFIKKLENEFDSVFSTGYFSKKRDLVKMLNQINERDDLPADISNNHKLLQHIIENVTEIERNFNVFYCLFPIEIDKSTLDAKKLYELKNPEDCVTITDIDAVVAIFNKSKFEFYLIEGKASGHVRSQVNDDFINRIKPNLRFPNSLPPINIVRIPNLCRGGYVCYKN